MPANNLNTNRVITILIHFDKTHFQNFFVMLLRRVAKDVTSLLLSGHKRYDFNHFDVVANENALYKNNELELVLNSGVGKYKVENFVFSPVSSLPLWHSHLFVWRSCNLVYLAEVCIHIVSNNQVVPNTLV